MPECCNIATSIIIQQADNLTASSSPESNTNESPTVAFGPPTVQGWREGVCEDDRPFLKVTQEDLESFGPRVMLSRYHKIIMCTIPKVSKPSVLTSPSPYAGSSHKYRLFLSQIGVAY